MASSTTIGANGTTNLATGTSAAQDPNAAVVAEQNRTAANLQPPDNQQATSSTSGAQAAPTGIVGSVMGNATQGAPVNPPATTGNAGSVAQPAPSVAQANNVADPYGIKAALKAEQAVTPAQATGLAGAGAVMVDPSKTSAGLIASMMNDNSPLMQQARTQALQRQNELGTLNSSMAITAGQDAAYRAMTPLATNDSQIYEDAQRTNANNSTQLAGINNQAAFQAARDASLHGYNIADAGLSAAYGSQKLDQQHQADLQNIAANGAITKAVANINSESAKAINETSHQYQALIQGSGSAASIWSNAQNQIASIIQDKTLDAASKQRAIDTINMQARSGLQMIGALAGNVDIASYMDNLFGQEPAQNQTPGLPPPNIGQPGPNVRIPATNGVNP